MPGFLDDLLNAGAEIPAEYQTLPVIPSEGIDPLDDYFPPEIYEGGGIWQPAPSWWERLRGYIDQGLDIYGDIAGSQNPTTQPSGGIGGLPATVGGMPINSVLLAGGAVLAVYLLTKRRR